MEIPSHQIDEIKKNIIDQINSNLPEEQKASAIQQIESMDGVQLQEFITQNNLIKNKETEGGQCIFCSIIKGDTPSYKIAENENAIAVLEINPLSRGHTIIIPKVHVQEVSQETQEFAKQISSKLKEKLALEDVQIQDSEIFGHKIINLIPPFDEKTTGGKRQPAPKSTLEYIQRKLTKETEEEVIEEPKEPELITEKDNWLPKRIP